MWCCRLDYFVSLFFFFKQKTAYEMRISDWSSDVCSSDLQAIRDSGLEADEVSNERTGIIMGSGGPSTRAIVEAADITREKGPKQIGRASCRERVGQYV